jgi:uncharacterized membrane protein YjdF
MKNYTPGRIAVLIITLAYIGAGALYFTREGNGEFFWYIGTMLVIVAFVVATIGKSSLPTWLLSLLSLWGLLHFLGGGLPVGNGVLYSYVVFPIWLDGDFTVLRYDQVVHFYGFGLVALVIYDLLRRSTTLHNNWMGALAFFTAMGFGALNELIEFLAVLSVPETGVGGYYNTGLDIVANALGEICAAFIAPYLFKERPH